MLAFELVAQGLIQGSIYALVALGLTLVYGLLRILHVAHAALFTLDASTGALTPFQIVPSLADTYTGNSRSSSIAVNQAGTVLYVSNRGEDSVAVFAIDAESGRLSLVQTQAAMGRTPRFFTLSPNNRWMYVLNEDSDSIVTMQVNPVNGTLSPTPNEMRSGSPVCMVFV